MPPSAFCLALAAAVVHAGLEPAHERIGCVRAAGAAVVFAGVVLLALA